MLQLASIIPCNIAAVLSVAMQNPPSPTCDSERHMNKPGLRQKIARPRFPSPLRRQNRKIKRRITQIIARIM